MASWRDFRFTDTSHRIPAGTAVMQNYNAIADAAGAEAAMHYLSTFAPGSVNPTNLAAKVGGSPSFVNLFTPPYAAGSQLAHYFAQRLNDPSLVTMVPPQVAVANWKAWIGTPPDKRRDWYTDRDTRQSVALVA